MKYDQFRQWAEEHGWLLMSEADIGFEDHRWWLTPAGRAVLVKLLPYKTDIAICASHEEWDLSTSDS